MNLDVSKTQIMPSYLLVQLEKKRTQDEVLGMENPTVRGKEKFAEVIGTNFTYTELNIKRDDYPKKGDMVLLPKVGGQAFIANDIEYQAIHIKDLALWMEKEFYLQTIASSDQSNHTVNY